jgi:hypothetical protein
MKCLYILIVFFPGGYVKAQTTVITPLPMLAISDTVKSSTGIQVTRLAFFLVDYGDAEFKTVEKQISLFVNKNPDSNNVKLKAYNMIFYKKSAIMNLENINSYNKENRYKVLDYEKPIEMYNWFLGKLTIVTYRKK